MKCKYCGSLRKSKKSLVQHELKCPSNDQRVYKNGMSGKTAWNKGLTKEDNPILKRSAATRQKISEAGGTPHTKEFKEAQSKRAKERGLGGVTQSRWIQYKGKTLGSSYELAVAKSLDKHDIVWDTCSRFAYVDPTGKQRTYTPDFYLEEYDVYLDPKNDFLIEQINPALGFNDVEKIQLVEEQNGIRVIILNKSQLDWDTIYQLL